MGASRTDIASTETPAPSRRPRFSVRAPADPGLAALRRAARAAIVIPPVLAFNALVLHGGQNVIFAVFGCFALLVMSDFGGPRPARAIAYLAATFVGALLVAARRARRRARRASAATAHRPAGPTRRDRAFVQLLTEMQRVLDIVDRPFQHPRVSIRPCIAEGDRLAAAIVSALRRSADVLTAESPPDLRAVDQARDLHRAALDRWAADQLRAGRPVDEVLDGLDVDHTLRVVGYVTIALATNAVIAAGGRPDGAVSLPVTAPRLEGARGTAIRVMRTIRTHLETTA